MEPPEPLVWYQKDEMKLKCTECQDIVRAEVADLHDCVR